MVTKIIKKVDGSKNNKQANYSYLLYFAPLKIKTKVPRLIGDLYFSKQN